MRYLLATILFKAVTISAMFIVDIELFGKFTFMIVLPRLCRGPPSQQQRIACTKLTRANIAFHNSADWHWTAPWSNKSVIPKIIWNSLSWSRYRFYCFYYTQMGWEYFQSDSLQSHGCQHFNSMWRLIEAAVQIYNFSRPKNNYSSTKSNAKALRQSTGPNEFASRLQQDRQRWCYFLRSKYEMALK